MFKAIIFDLDNCLSAADEVGRELCEPGLDAIRRANDGVVSEEVLQKAFSDFWRIPFDKVAEQYGFSEKMFSAGWEKFSRMEVRKPMCGYSDLKVLEELPLLRFLVTTGFRRLQESKIRALGFGDLFAGIFVDAIDERGEKGKERIFRKIIETHDLEPERVLVVGDSPGSEIAAGNRLGCTTVQILRPGVPKGNTAVYYIEGLAELKALLRRPDSGV